MKWKFLVPPFLEFSRRNFLKAPLSLGGLAGGSLAVFADKKSFLTSRAAQMLASELPQGGAPPALVFPHFPDRLHAFIWRNWQLVPIDRLAKVDRKSVG